MIINLETFDELFNETTINRFTFHLRYNIKTYVDLYSYFVKTALQKIIDYYEDSQASPDVESFYFLERLLIESSKIDSLIKSNKNSFGRIDDWELLDFLEDMRTNLQTIYNANKWTRSSKSIQSWKGNVIQTTYTLQDSETLEHVSQEVYGAFDSQNDWMRISLENNLLEMDYEVDSNAKLQVNKKVLSSPNYFAFSIIDSLINEKLYGLDFYKKLLFESDDLKTIDYRDTVIQSVEILMKLKKGDVPEFPNFGLDSKITIGGNIGGLLHTNVVRQLEKVFQTDDSLRNFNVTRISYQNGDLVIEFQVDTLYNLTYNSSTSI